MTPEQTAAKFLTYALAELNFSYDELTDYEQTLSTREEFEALVKWVREKAPQQ
ncbi:hypothetical protein [Myxococcus phage Mx1]|nr:hypothetical protein [Myxococcus phage Mx1]